MIVDLLQDFEKVWLILGGIIGAVSAFVTLRVAQNGLRADVAEIREQLSNIEAEMATRAAAAERRFSEHEALLARIDERWRDLRRALERIEKSDEQMDQKLDRLIERHMRT